MIIMSLRAPCAEFLYMLHVSLEHRTLNFITFMLYSLCCHQSPKRGRLKASRPPWGMVSVINDNRWISLMSLWMQGFTYNSSHLNGLYIHIIYGSLDIIGDPSTNYFTGLIGFHEDWKKTCISKLFRQNWQHTRLSYHQKNISSQCIRGHSDKFQKHHSEQLEADKINSPDHPMYPENTTSVELDLKQKKTSVLGVHRIIRWWSMCYIGRSVQ